MSIPKGTNWKAKFYDLVADLRSCYIQDPELGEVLGRHTGDEKCSHGVLLSKYCPQCKEAQQ